MPKILIVEDELPIADLIRLTLKSAGYLCDHAPDGDQAADLAAAGNYDLALVDVMLPRTDGFTLLEYFQSLELPVIFVTARSAVADRVKGLKLGAEDYIVKPFDVAELLARVETVLRRFHKTADWFYWNSAIVNIIHYNISYFSTKKLIHLSEYLCT